MRNYTTRILKKQYLQQNLCYGYLKSTELIKPHPPQFCRCAADGGSGLSGAEVQGNDARVCGLHGAQGVVNAVNKCIVQREACGLQHDAIGRKEGFQRADGIRRGKHGLLGAKCVGKCVRHLAVLGQQQLTDATDARTKQISFHPYRRIRHIRQADKHAARGILAFLLGDDIGLRGADLVNDQIALAVQDLFHERHHVLARAGRDGQSARDALTGILLGGDDQRKIGQCLLADVASSAHRVEKDQKVVVKGEYIVVIIGADLLGLHVGTKHVRGESAAIKP